jgi:hypothetical protein
MRKPAVNARMQIGDLVETPHGTGPIIGFNQPGEGGKQHVHVLVNGMRMEYMAWELIIIQSSPRGR